MAAKRETRPANGGQKPIAHALQGGGAHGAFAWGMLDRLLEDGRLAVEGVSATPAGTMNAAALVHGLMQGGPEGARTALREFWHDIAGAAEMSNPFRKLPWEKFLHNGYAPDQSPMYLMTDMMLRMLLPYQFNPLNFNPLGDVLEKHVDFDALRKALTDSSFSRRHQRP